MTIAKSEVISFWNEARKGGLASDATTLDEALQACLNDLSNINLLLSSDTTQTLTSSSTYLAYPTLYKDLLPGGIILTDSSSYDHDPLVSISWTEYKQNMVNFNSGTRGSPSLFCENDKKFYLYAPPADSYTSTIWFYKYHAKDVATIEFGEEFRNAINFGTVFFKSAMQGNAKYVSIWGPLYQAEKDMRRMNINEQPYIVKG